MGRRRGDALAVVILTARDQVTDRIEGLKAGADDYLVKPFDLDELNARLNAVARRYFGTTATAKQFGPVRIELEARQVRLDGVKVELTAREWAVLEVLVLKFDQKVSVDLEALKKGLPSSAPISSASGTSSNSRRSAVGSAARARADAMRVAWIVTSSR